MVKFSGAIARILSHDSDSGFSILKVKATDAESSALAASHGDAGGYMTVIGNYFNPTPGAYVTAQGAVVKDPKWGAQLKAEAIFITSAVRRRYEGEFVASGLFVSVQQHKLIKLSKEFGNPVIRVLNASPSEILDKGILTKQEIMALQAEWGKLARLLKPFSYLRALGMSSDVSLRVIDSYGIKGDTVVANDPYSILSTNGVGFSSLDTIAKTMGIENTNLRRLCHGARYLLDQHIDRGNTGISVNDLAAKLSKTMSVAIDRSKEAIQQEVNEGGLTSVVIQGSPYLVDYELFKAEQTVVRELSRLIRGKSTPLTHIAEVGAGYLNEGQASAIKKTLSSKVAVITGGPGTGKTTTLEYLISSLNKSSASEPVISMSAFTGTAATKMQESTGLSASTMHDALEYHPEQGFRRNEKNPIEADLVVVDELSMVDIVLFANFLKAVPDHARVVFLGDPNQLLPVGAGQALLDLINSGSIEVSKLTKTERTGSSKKPSNITHNANRILEGKLPEKLKDGKNDFWWIDAPSDQDIHAKIDAAVRSIPAKFDTKPANIQILSPQKKGLVGTDTLNKSFRNHFNQSQTGSDPVVAYGETFRVNDRVMQIKTDKELKVNNGDAGIIKRISHNTGEVDVKFRLGLKTLPISNLARMRISWASTVHKSQGSEYPYVIIPVTESHSSMLTRQILFTAITRGMKGVFVIGQRSALEKALKNTKTQERTTFLSGLLKNTLSPVNQNNYVPDPEPERTLAMAQR